jgi:hypothetical protein
MAGEPTTGVLVELLHEASESEHCLLDSYLYAACSLKTHPVEPLTRAAARRFVLYESTDALQEEEDVRSRVDGPLREAARLRGRPVVRIAVVITTPARARTAAASRTPPRARLVEARCPPAS